MINYFYPDRYILIVASDKLSGDLHGSVAILLITVHHVPVLALVNRGKNMSNGSKAVLHRKNKYNVIISQDPNKSMIIASFSMVVTLRYRSMQLHG